MEIKIRPWQEGDIEKITAAEQVCFTDPWKKEDFLSALTLPVYCGLVMEEGEKLLGYACGISVCDEGEVANIAILPSERGKGLGNKLLLALLENLKARGAEKCFLEVRVSNLAAISLYEKFGFEKIGVRKRYYPDGEDAFLMTAKL